MNIIILILLCILMHVYASSTGIMINALLKTTHWFRIKFNMSQIFISFSFPLLSNIIYDTATVTFYFNKEIGAPKRSNLLIYKISTNFPVFLGLYEVNSTCVWWLQIYCNVTSTVPK